MVENSCLGNNFKYICCTAADENHLPKMVADYKVVDSLFTDKTYLSGKVSYLVDMYFFLEEKNSIDFLNQFRKVLKFNRLKTRSLQL